MAVLLEERHQLLNLLCKKNGPSQGVVLPQAQTSFLTALGLAHKPEQREHPAEQPSFLDIPAKWDAHLLPLPSSKILDRR